MHPAKKLLVTSKPLFLITTFVSELFKQNFSFDIKEHEGNNISKYWILSGLKCE